MLKKDLSILLGIIVLSSPVFLSFGYVGRHFGLAMASGLTNTLTVAGPILVGLIFREEIRRLPHFPDDRHSPPGAGITLLACFRARGD